VEDGRWEGEEGKKDGMVCGAVVKVVAGCSRARVGSVGNAEWMGRGTWAIYR
jgi:hypothetical protein